MRIVTCRGRTNKIEKKVNETLDGYIPLDYLAKNRDLLEPSVIKLLTFWCKTFCATPQLGPRLYSHKIYYLGSAGICVVFFCEIFQCLTSFYGKTWRHREKSQLDARWVLSSRLFSKKPRPSRMIRSWVIVQNCVLNMFKFGQRIAEKLNSEILTWCGNTDAHAHRQTHTQTGVKQYFANPLWGKVITI